MSHIKNSLEELEPTNGSENIDSLQIETEEYTQGDSAAETTPRHNPDIWGENISEDKNDSEENEKEESKDNGEKGKRRYNKKNNRRIANLKRVKDQKKQKLASLKSKRDVKKADKTRGYLVVSLGNNTKHNKQVKLDAVDKEVLTSGIYDLEVEIYELEGDIKNVKDQISSLANAKASSSKDKLSKMKENKKVNDLVARIDRELTKAAKNGNAQIISEIRLQAHTGNTNKAYESIKSFLSENVETVSKQLDKSSQLQDSVLNKIIEKISKVQS
jgi:hypothetical protein